MNCRPSWRSAFDTTDRSPFGTGKSAQSSAHTPVPSPYQVRCEVGAAEGEAVVGGEQHRLVEPREVGDQPRAHHRERHHAREQEQEELARERQRLQHQHDRQHHQREQQAELGARQHRQPDRRRRPTPRSTGCGARMNRYVSRIASATASVASVSDITRPSLIQRLGYTAAIAAASSPARSPATRAPEQADHQHHARRRRPSW